MAAFVLIFGVSDKLFEVLEVLELFDLVDYIGSALIVEHSFELLLIFIKENIFPGIVYTI